MTALTLELEHKLATLDPPAAAALETMIRGALDLVEISHAGQPPAAAVPATAPVSREEELGYPEGYFKKFRGIFADQPFERPEQLPYEKREEW